MAKVCGCVHIGARTAEGGINYGAKGGGQAWSGRCISVVMKWNGKYFKFPRKWIGTRTCLPIFGASENRLNNPRVFENDAFRAGASSEERDG